MRRHDDRAPGFNDLSFDPRHGIAGFLAPKDLVAFKLSSRANHTAAAGVYLVVHGERFDADMQRIDRYLTENPGESLGTLVFRFPSNAPDVPLPPWQWVAVTRPWLSAVTEVRFEQPERSNAELFDFEMSEAQWKLLWSYVAALSSDGGGGLEGLSLQLKSFTGMLSMEYMKAAPALVAAIEAGQHSLRRAFVSDAQPSAVLAAVCRCPNLCFLHIDLSYLVIHDMLREDVFPACESVSILDRGTFNEYQMLGKTRAACLAFWTRLVLSPQIQRLALHSLDYIAPDVDHAIYAPDMSCVAGRAIWIHRPNQNVRLFRSLYNGVREVHLCFVAGLNFLSPWYLKKQNIYIERMLEAISGVYIPPRVVNVDVFCHGAADTLETSGTMQKMLPLCVAYPRDRGFVFTFYVRSDVAEAYNPLPPSIVLKPYSRTALDKWGWDPNGINYNL